MAHSKDNLVLEQLEREARNIFLQLEKTGCSDRLLVERLLVLLSKVIASYNKKDLELEELRVIFLMFAKFEFEEKINLIIVEALALEYHIRL